MMHNKIAKPKRFDFRYPLGSGSSQITAYKGGPRDYKNGNQCGFCCENRKRFNEFKSQLNYFKNACKYDALAIFA